MYIASHTLGISWLIALQMPAELQGSFLEFDAIRQDFIAGKHKNKNLLQTAQWGFDIQKKTLKHETKVGNNEAARHPHVPVVSSISDSKDTLSSALMVLRDSFVAAMEQQNRQHAQVTTALMGEIRELRRVSKNIDRPSFIG